jgi:hypothetical protein
MPSLLSLSGNATFNLNDTDPVGGAEGWEGRGPGGA